MPSVQPGRHIRSCLSVGTELKTKPTLLIIPTSVHECEAFLLLMELALSCTTPHPKPSLFRLCSGGLSLFFFPTAVL